METEVELEIGIPDYYRDDLNSYEFEKFIETLTEKSIELGVTPELYLLEFAE
jgi:hypothetical protein